MDKIKITAIVGSLRRDSYNRQLAMEAKQVIGSLAEFELLDYSDVPLMNEDIESPVPESVRRVRANIQSADGLWFFSPEYNHFFPGVLKNLIDWLSRPTGVGQAPLLSGKPAAVSGISIGMSGTLIAQDHLITLLSFLNMRIMNHARLSIPYATQQTDQSKRLTLTSSAPFLEKQVQEFIRFIRFPA